MKKLSLFTFCISLNILGAAPAQSSAVVNYVEPSRSLVHLPLAKQAKKVERLEKKVEEVKPENYQGAEKLISRISGELLVAMHERDREAQSKNLRRVVLGKAKSQKTDSVALGEVEQKPLINGGLDLPRYNALHSFIEKMSELRQKAQTKRYNLDNQPDFSSPKELIEDNQDIAKELRRKEIKQELEQLVKTAQAMIAVHKEDPVDLGQDAEEFCLLIKSKLFKMAQEVKPLCERGDLSLISSDFYRFGGNELDVLASKIVDLHDALWNKLGVAKASSCSGQGIKPFRVKPIDLPGDIRNRMHADRSAFVRRLQKTNDSAQVVQPAHQAKRRQREDA
jgi:hypothetical protein